MGSVARSHGLVLYLCVRDKLDVLGVDGAYLPNGVCYHHAILTYVVNVLRDVEAILSAHVLNLHRWLAVKDDLVEILVMINAVVEHACDSAVLCYLLNLAEKHCSLHNLSALPGLGF